MMGIKRIFRISLLRPRDIEREVDDEIAFHIHLTQRQVRYPSAARDYVIEEVKKLFGERARRKAETRPRGRTGTDSRRG